MSPVIYTPPTPHRCELPYVTRSQPQIHLVPAHPEGTLWKCDDCGAVWRVEGRQSEEDRRAGLTALSTEWVRIVTGDEEGGIPDEMVLRAKQEAADQVDWAGEAGLPMEEVNLDGVVDFRRVLTAALTPKAVEA